MKMIQAKVDRVCYDLESNLNNFKCLSSSRGRIKILRGKPSGVGQSERALNCEVPPTDQDIEEPFEEEFVSELH